MRGENIKIERLLEKYSPFFTNMACGSKNIKVFKVDCPPNAWVFLRLMVLNAAIVGGIIYGKVAGNSLAEISENLKKLGFDVPRSSVANTIEKHFDDRGRPRAIESIAVRAPAGRPTKKLGGKVECSIQKYIRDNRGKKIVTSKKIQQEVEGAKGG